MLIFSVQFAETPKEITKIGEFWTGIAKKSKHNLRLDADACCLTRMTWAPDAYRSHGLFFAFFSRWYLNRVAQTKEKKEYNCKLIFFFLQTKMRKCLTKFSQIFKCGAAQK